MRISISLAADGGGMASRAWTARSAVLSAMRSARRIRASSKAGGGLMEEHEEEEKEDEDDEEEQCSEGLISA